MSQQSSSLSSFLSSSTRGGITATTTAATTAANAASTTARSAVDVVAPIQAATTSAVENGGSVTHAPFFTWRSFLYLATGVACGILIINLSHSFGLITGTGGGGADKPNKSRKWKLKKPSVTVSGEEEESPDGVRNNNTNNNTNQSATTTTITTSSSSSSSLSHEHDNDSSASIPGGERPNSVASSRSDGQWPDNNSDVDFFSSSSPRRRQQEHVRRRLRLELEREKLELEAALLRLSSRSTPVGGLGESPEPERNSERMSSPAPAHSLSPISRPARLDTQRLQNDPLTLETSASEVGTDLNHHESNFGTPQEESSRTTPMPVLLSPLHSSEEDISPATERRRRARNRVSWRDGVEGSDFDETESQGQASSTGVSSSGARAYVARRGRRMSGSGSSVTSSQDDAGADDATADSALNSTQNDEFEDGADEDEDDENNSEDSDSESLEAAYTEESKGLLQLLFSIAEDNARKDGFVHRSITCNHCGTSPIRGFRFKCANCADYDICEICEAAEVHTKNHVFIKLRIPLPPHVSPRTVLPVFYPGSAITEKLSTAVLSELQRDSHFDQVEILAFYEQFKSLATVEPSETSRGGITREIFEQCLGPIGAEKNLITDRIFAFFDQDQDGLICFKELVHGMSIMCKGSLDERIIYAFRGYDIDGDGRISREELLRMFKAYFYLSMELVRDFVKTMEEGMMESFDDEASKPVSASFSAPIVGSGVVPNDDEEKEEPNMEATASLLLSSSGIGNSTDAVSRHGGLAGSQPSDFATSHSQSSTTTELARRIREKRRQSTHENEFAAGSSSLQTDHLGSATSSTAPRSASPTNAHSMIPPSPSSSPLPPIIGGSTGNPGGLLSRGARALQEVQLKRRSNTNMAAAFRMGSSSSTAASPGAVAGTNILARSPTPGAGEGSSDIQLSPVTMNGPSAFEDLAIEAGMMAPEQQQWPIIEAMSQEAIVEMVDKTFAAAGAADPRFITLPEFRRAVESDNSYLQWFEALGSVF